MVKRSFEFMMQGTTPTWKLIIFFLALDLVKVIKNNVQRCCGAQAKFARVCYAAWCLDWALIRFR